MYDAQPPADHSDGAGFAAEDGRLLGELLRLPYQAVVANVHAAFIAAGFDDLRPAHLSIFQHIDHPPGGSRLTVLADRAQMTRQAMAELVDSLVGRGYLERAPDPRDRRAKIIRLTERGWAVHETAAVVVKDLEVRWAERFGADKMTHLRALLRELIATFGA